MEICRLKTGSTMIWNNCMVFNAPLYTDVAVLVKLEKST